MHSNAPCDVWLISAAFLRRRGGDERDRMVPADSKSLLGLCPAGLGPECASRLGWLLWEDRTLHLHILSVSSVGKLGRPLARSARNPTMSQKQRCASPTRPPSRTETGRFSRAPRPSLAEPNCHYGLDRRWRRFALASSRVFFFFFPRLFIVSPCHDRSQKGATNHTSSREQ